MNSIVKEIIRKVDKGNAFDSHYVIDTIIRDHSDEYLTFVANNLASSKVTEYAHSQIAKVIASFSEELVRKFPNRSISYNIRGRASSCALWERI